MTRTHGGPLIIPAEKRSYPISPRMIKYRPSAEGEATGCRDNRFYLCKPVSLADHVLGLFTLRGEGSHQGSSPLITHNAASAVTSPP